MWRLTSPPSTRSNSFGSDLATPGIVFAIARVKQNRRDDVDASGLTARIGEQHLYPTLPTAVAAYQADRNAGPLGPPSG
jgi:hypothetical protein